jgi:hypothetical protein
MNNKESPSPTNSGSKVCNSYPKHSPGTRSTNIWIQLKELKIWIDGNGTNIVAAVQEVANTVSSKSSKWIFETGASSYMTSDRNCFESFSSVVGKVVLADKP